jgi:hypothetical protein
MIVTGKTKKNAFKYLAQDEQLTIFVNARYEKIIEGNNIGGSFTRKNQVALFPMESTVSAFEKSDMIQALKSEVTEKTEKYFRDVLGIDVRKTIRI